MRLANAFTIWLAIACGCQGDGGTAGSDDGGANRSSARAGAGGTPDDGDAAPPACVPPDGAYDAVYTPLSGTCGAVRGPARVTFEAGPGVSMRVERQASFDVTTEIVLRACAARVTQVVEQQGEVVLRISAELTVDADGLPSGTATVTQFENGVVACNGTYSVELRLASTTLTETDAGTSADAAASAPDSGLSPDVQSKIEYDCAQTVMCSIQRGSMLSMDPLARCVEDTTALLAANPDRLATCLDVFGACEQFVVCDYVACATAQR
jgi:hypothetical protein